MQDIHAETPLYKQADINNNNNLYGFELMTHYVDQNFLEGLRSSAQFHDAIVPEKKNKRAFGIYIDDAMKAALTHDFAALNDLARLLLQDKKSAQYYDLYAEVSQVVMLLREHHQHHENRLTVVAKNLHDIYSDAIQGYAAKRLQDFTHLNCECKLRQRVSGDASLALEMIARDIDQYFKWKVKPEFVQHLSKVLSIFNHKFDDLYAMVISNYIVVYLKAELDFFLQGRVPMLPDTRKKYQEYSGLLQQVLDKDALPQESIDGEENDFELSRMGNF